jgi:hypothetical protein
MRKMEEQKETRAPYCHGERMERKEIPAPYCCGERMDPIYRYRAEDGILYVTWVCHAIRCHHTEELQLYYDEEDGELDEK